MDVMIDTSCIHALLSPKLDQPLRDQLPLDGSSLSTTTSLYLRMEFLRRWIMTGIEIDFSAKELGGLTQALGRYSDRFSSRDVKQSVKWAALYIEEMEKGIPGQGIELFAGMIHRISRVYDKAMMKGGSAQPKTHCRKSYWL